MDDDEEDVFASSIIDRYAARPPILVNMCLATFAVNYNIVQANNDLIEVQETDANELSKTEEYDTSTKITLKIALDTCIKGNKKQFCMSGDTNFKQSHKNIIIQN